MSSAIVGGRDAPPSAGRRLSSRHYAALVTGSILALVVAFAAAVAAGSVWVPPERVVLVLSNQLTGWPATGWEPVEEQIVWQFRLPRALLAVAVGAGLALVGAVLQAVVRNALADPYLLGISSGASLGAVVVLVLGSGAALGLSLSGAAFVGAVLALTSVYLVAQHDGRIRPVRLILAGVALGYLFTAAYSFLVLRADVGRQAEVVLYWLLGSLSGARWDGILVPIVVVAVGSLLLLRRAPTLNALLSGEEAAVTLGVPLARMRVELVVVTSLMIGAMVAASGAIAFVGLIVPHAVRLVVGADHRRLLPLSLVWGATFLLLADLAARTVDVPQELPLTIVTAAVGVPFFIWLLRSRDRDGRLTVA